MIFSRRHFGLLGIDLAADHVQLLQLSRRSRTFRIEHWSKLAYPEGQTREDVLLDPSQFLPDLRTAVSALHMRDRRCLMAVPVTATIRRVLKIPGGLSTAEMEGQVRLEAHHVLPLSVEELSLDYDLVDDAEHWQETSAQVSVRLVATRRILVQQMMHLVSSCGLELEFLGLANEAIQSALRWIGQDRTIHRGYGAMGLLDVRPDGVALYVCAGGKVLSEHEFPIDRSFDNSLPAASQLREWLDQSLSLSAKEIADFCVICRDGRSDFWANILAEGSKRSVRQGHPLLFFERSAASDQALQEDSLQQASLLVVGLALKGLA